MRCCEYCGKALPDDARFCVRCGKNCQGEIEIKIPMFCKKCGGALENSGPYWRGCKRCGITVLEGYPGSTNPLKPKNSKRLWIAAAAAVVAILLVVFFLSGGFVKRVEFPDDITEESLTAFTQVVCENMSDDVTCEIRGRLYDRYELVFKTEDLAGIRYTSWVSLPSPKNGRYRQIVVGLGGNMPGFEDKAGHQSAYTLMRDVTEALEKTLSGFSKSGRYIKSFKTMQNRAEQVWHENDPAGKGVYEDVAIEEYWLMDGVHVEIKYTLLTDRIWNMQYIITFVGK